MRAKLLALAAVLALCSCAKTEDPSLARAEALCRASLRMVRVNMLSHAGESGPDERAAAADSMFSVLQRAGGPCVQEYISTGAGDCAEQVGVFVEMVRGLDLPSSGVDPADAVLKVLRKAPEVAGSAAPLLEGYAAALQWNMDESIEIGRRLRLIEFMQMIGAPVTCRDLGLSDVDTLRLKELAESMANFSGSTPYGAEPFDFFIAMRRLDDVGSRFGRQKTAADLARAVMIYPEFNGLRGPLSELPPLKAAFLGDSQTDNRHWSSPAHYPAILEAIFNEFNPAVTVINAGVGGDDSGEALARLDKDVIEKAPDICFVLLGGNDCMFWGRDHSTVSPGKHRENIAETVSRLKAAGCRVVLMTYPRIPVLDERERAILDALNANFAGIVDSLGAESLSIGELLNAREPRRMFSPDMIHLSPEAHALMTLAILDYLVR